MEFHNDEKLVTTLPFLRSHVKQEEPSPSEIFLVREGHSKIHLLTKEMMRMSKKPFPPGQKGNIGNLLTGECSILDNLEDFSFLPATGNTFFGFFIVLF